MSSRGRGSGSRGGGTRNWERPIEETPDSSDTITPTLSRQDDRHVIKISMLTSHNYSHWKSTMGIYLEYKGLLYMCKNKVQDPNDPVAHRHNLEALLIFRTKLAPDIFNSIKLTCDKSAQKSWMQLKSNYATATISSIYQV
jgi:hypothetical protein